MKKIKKIKQPIGPPQAGFSLIELLIAMAVVLVLVSALVVSGARAARASRETSAAQSVATLASVEQNFEHAWQGFSPLGTNLAGSELAGTTPATFAADEDLSTTQANALDAGFTQNGYKIIYKAGPTTFTDSSGNTVSNSFEFTAIPTNTSDIKSYCADPTGVWFNTLGTGATIATGAGCKTDGYISQ
jgi:prepilin-type N-terminal cleavage/methylation domain-containing protein